jgi:diguanylate cyclase
MASDATGRAAPAELAKAALRRLVLDKQEPTPENYARAYAQEAGDLVPAGQDGAALAALIGKLARGLERGGRNWTAARKKDSLQRVLDGSRSDARRLQQRLSQLVASWDGDTPDEAPETAPAPLDEVAAPVPPAAPALEPLALSEAAHWDRVVGALGGTTCQALPPQDESAQKLGQALAAVQQRLVAEGATAPLADQLDALCRQAGLVLQHRHHLVDQLGTLCQELTASLTDLAEDDSWARGQCEAMRSKLDEGLTARGVRSVSELLRDTRERQGALRAEREKARDALKSLINRMLSELGELGSQTGRFHESVGRYADVIEKADSLESLAGVVREMVEESRTVQALVQQTQARLQEEHSRASELTQRVGELEGELKRLSSEVSTDQLTQIANRRGLLQAFEAERARVERSSSPLAVGLLDIDNFKRLNDQLGHAAGDEALRALAAAVSKALRPSDLVARFGGEEFVVLLPGTGVEEGQQILTRLQRTLSGSLFMHDNKPVFVTFSAGVTDYRVGEALEAALERADQGLYEAKRTGKNRTCVA